MFASAAKTVARRAVTSHLTSSSNLTTRFSALSIRPIAVRSFSVYHSPLLAAARGSGATKKTTTKKATKTTKTTKKTTKKAAPKPKKKAVRKKKELTPEELEKADIRRLKKLALWNQEPSAGNGSGWAVYVSEQLGNKKLEENTTLTEKMRGLRDQWSELSDYDKERYKSQAELLAEQRKKERKEWIESIPAEQIHLANQARGTLLRKYNKKSRKLQDERIPKRPMSAFSRFFISWFNSSPDQTADLAAKDRFSKAAAQWKTMSEEEKAPYVKEYNEAQEQFNAETADFREGVEKLRKSSPSK